MSSAGAAVATPIETDDRPCPLCEQPIAAERCLMILEDGSVRWAHPTCALRAGGETITATQADGRSRHAADADAQAVAVALNVLRTHYTVSQRAMFAARIANATAGEGRARKKTKNSLDAQLTTPQAVTLEEAGQQFGVNRSYVIKAKLVQREAAPEVTQAVERGTAA